MVLEIKHRSQELDKTKEKLEKVHKQLKIERQLNKLI